GPERGAGEGCGAADAHVVGLADVNAIERIAASQVAGAVRADLVALDQGVGGPGARDRDAEHVVARDDVAGPGRGAADGDAAAGDDNAVPVVAQEAVGVAGQADDVGLDPGVARAGVDLDAILAVARNQVAGPDHGPVADGGAGRGVRDGDAVRVGLVLLR